MDTQQFLEDLLKSGSLLAKQGQALAVEGVEKAKEGLAEAKEQIELQIPEAGPERDKMIQQLGVGAAAGGLLAMLVGTKTGRKVLSPAIKLGSLAALGTVGYRVYQKWQQEQGLAIEGASIEQLDAAPRNARALTIVRAMIAAAKADGIIDAQERDAIAAKIKASDLDDSASKLMIDEMLKPLDVAEIAAETNSPEAAVEVYLASMAIVDVDNPQERQFLDQLAAAMQIAPGLKASIEAEAFAVN
jgi:uncharacterized membrane protein YebE (DUF533 family)